MRTNSWDADKRECTRIAVNVTPSQWSVVLWSVVWLVASPALAQWAPRREIDPNKPLVKQLPQKPAEDVKSLLSPVRPAPEDKKPVPDTPVAGPVHVSMASVLAAPRSPSGRPVDPNQPVVKQITPKQGQDLEGLLGPVWPTPDVKALPSSSTSVGPVHVSLPSLSLVEIPGIGGEGDLAPVAQRAAVNLARLRAGERSTEVLDWLNQLPKQELLRLIEGTPQGRDQQAVNDLLASALLKHPDVSLDNLDGLSGRCVRAIAGCLGRRGDKRCVNLYEALLGKRKSKANSPAPELDGLAEYYRKVGDHAKAAETYLRAGDYSIHKPFLANCAVEAARDYLRSGDEKKANELYDQVAQHGYGWATGLAVVERAMRLVSQKKFAEADTVLESSLSGLYADQVKVAVLYAKGHSAYKQGNLQEALRWHEAALKHFDSLTDPLTGEGLEGVRNSARRELHEVKAWLEKPIRVSTDSIRLVKRPLDRSVSLDLAVFTHRDIPLEYQVGVSLIRIEERPKESAQGFIAHPITLSLAPDASPGKCKTALQVTSTAHPSYRVEVPVEVEVSGSLDWTPKTLFLGVCKPGQRFERTVTLSSLKPFRTVKVDTGAAWIEAVCIVSSKKDNASENRCEIRLHGKAPSQGVSRGDLTIQTDLQGEEVVRIPWVLLLQGHAKTGKDDS